MRVTAQSQALDGRRMPLGRALSRWHAFAGKVMNISLSLTPLVSLAAGILILIMPKLLNYIVAGYLIVVGVIGVFSLNI